MIFSGWYNARTICHFLLVRNCGCGPEFWKQLVWTPLIKFAESCHQNLLHLMIRLLFHLNLILLILFFVVVVVVIVLWLCCDCVVIVSFHCSTILLLPFLTILSTLPCASLASMTTTATSFATLLSVYQERSGTIDFSNYHWIPLIYRLRLLYLKVVLQVLSKG